MTERDEGTTAADSWSRYWAGGALHSCPNAFAGNYDDEIRAHWQGFFTDLPDGARVLDIGTGNGAVAFLARDTARVDGKRFEIEAIDAAAIHPAAAATRLGIAADGIVFRGHTRCERTGYPERHFDAVSSQFAIEYMRIAESLAEIARIMAVGGRAAFVMHHAGSRAVAATRAELKAFAFLRHEAPLLLTARRLLRRQLAAATAARLEERDARRQFRELDKVLRRVAAYAQSRPHANFLQDIAAQVATSVRQCPAIGPAAALDRLTMLEDEMTAHAMRLRAMSDAGQSPEDVESFRQELANAGFAADSPRELLRGGADLLGWVCTATRES